jgi:methyl-accepting chemotaxis protein
MRIPSLKIWQKLSIVIMLMALPTTPLVYFYFESRNEQIAAAETERQGLAYLTELRLVLEALTTHRDVTQAFLAGDASLLTTVDSARPAMTSAMGRVDRIDAIVGASWETTPRWQTIKTGWSILLADGSLDARASAQRHTALVDLVLQQVRLVSDKSRLTTDPMLDTYYMLDAMVSGATPAIDSLSQLRAIGSATFARREAGPEQLAQIQFLIRQLSANIAALDRSLDSAGRYSPASVKTLEPAWKQASGSAKSVLELAQNDLQRPGSSDLTARAFYEKTGRAIADMVLLHEQTGLLVGGILTARVDSLKSQRSVQMTIVFVVLAIASALVLSISRGIARQAESIANLFIEIGAGNFSARAEVDSRDELGAMAEGLNLMLDNTMTLIESREEKERIQRSIMELLDEVSGVAAGDLTKDAEVNAGVTGAIADSFNYMLGELRQIISSVQSTTSEVAGSATQVQRTATQLAQGSETQSQQITQASAAIADMAKSIQQVSQSAATAAGIAQRALQDAQGGAATVRKTIDGMNAIRGRVQETSKRIKRLGESSQEIGEIVRLIGDIADRTSILALNASIQASTAGEAGKGFAVVAEEVERLAVRAAESAKKITALIKSVQSDTSEAMAAMEDTTREVVGGSQSANEAGKRLHDIEDVSRQIADLIARISQASQQQAAGSEEVSRNVAGITTITQQTASGAKETEVSTRRLAALAEQLNESLSRFKLPKS